MRTRTTALVVLAVVFVSWMAAGAQETDSAAYESAGYENAVDTRMSEMEAEIASLREQLQASMVGAHGGCGCGCDSGCGCVCDGCCGCGGCGCCGCGCTCCDPCCRSEGWVYGADLTVLKPHNSGGTGGSLAGVNIVAPGVALAIPAGALQVEPSFQASGRYWVGWQCCDGLGIRARYWDFDHDSNTAFAILGLVQGTVLHDWDTSVLDVEIFDATQLGCNWDATFSYGFRHVDYSESRSLNGVAGVAPLVFPVAAAAQKTFSGIGVTLAAELRRQLTCNLGLFANARGSALMGDENNSLNITVGGPAPVMVAVADPQRNDVKYIVETQAGFEYILPMVTGGYYFARAGVEVQYWDGFGVSPLAIVFDESAGFGGGFASVGVQR